MLDAGSVQARWNHFLSCNPAQQGSDPERQTTDYIRGFLRTLGVTYAGHRVLDCYAPAQEATAEHVESQQDVPPSTAGYGSDASSERSERSGGAGPDYRNDDEARQEQDTDIHSLAAEEAVDDARSNASTVRAKRDDVSAMDEDRRLQSSRQAAHPVSL